MSCCICLHGEHRIRAKKAAGQQSSHSDQHPHAHPLSLSISRQRPRSATSNASRPQWRGGGGATDRGPVFYTPMGVSEVEVPTAGLVPSHLSFLAEASSPPPSWTGGDGRSCLPASQSSTGEGAIDALTVCTRGKKREWRMIWSRMASGADRGPSRLNTKDGDDEGRTRHTACTLCHPQYELINRL